MGKYCSQKSCVDVSLTLMTIHVPGEHITCCVHMMTCFSGDLSWCAGPHVLGENGTCCHCRQNEYGQVPAGGPDAILFIPHMLESWNVPQDDCGTPHTAHVPSQDGGRS